MEPIVIGVLGGLAMYLMLNYEEMMRKKREKEVKQLLHHLLHEKNEFIVTEEERNELRNTLNEMKVNIRLEMWKKNKKGEISVRTIELENTYQLLDEMIDKMYVEELSTFDIEQYEEFWHKNKHFM